MENAYVVTGCAPSSVRPLTHVGHLKPSRIAPTFWAFAGELRPQPVTADRMGIAASDGAG